VAGGGLECAILCTVTASKPTPDDRRQEKLEHLARATTTDARTHWEQGFTHFLLSVQAPEYTAYLIQWVESVGWVLEHAGWIWAETRPGFGGHGLMNPGPVGNYLFGRPGGASSLAVRPPGDEPQRRDL